jgi:hypothetical protein
MLDRPGQDRSALHAWALAALAVIVCLRWQVHFSRTIFRAITPTLILILLTHAYLRFLDTRRIRWAALAGLWLGLGSYTYLSWRLVPLLVLLWILHGLWTKTLSGRRDLTAMGLMGFISLVVAAPLLADFIQHPEHFRGRTAEVSLFSTTEQRQLPDGSVQQVVIRKPLTQSLASIAGNAGSVALMWNWRGDHVAKHNLPHEPVFDPVTGIVFFIGVGVLLATARQQVVPFVLLTTLAVISLASVLSFGAPNILRTQAMIPAAVLTVIFGLRWIADRWTLHHPGSRRFLVPVIAVYLALSGAWQVWTYFGLMPRSIAVRQEFQTDNFYLPAVAVQKLSQSGQVRGRIWVPEELASHPTFAFASHGTRNMVTYPAQGWPIGQLEAGGTSPATIAKGDAVLLTLRSIDLASPRNLRAEVRAAGTNRRIATIPILQANGPPIPFTELTLIE